MNASNNWAVTTVKDHCMYIPNILQYILAQILRNKWHFPVLNQDADWHLILPYILKKLLGSQTKARIVRK